MNAIIKMYTDAFSGLKKDVYIFAFMMLINRLGTLILPFLTLYTTQQLGWTKIEAGTATMWFGIGSLSGALMGGYLTDKIGYYKTMIISLFSASFFFYILQFFTDFYMVCGFLFVSSMMADLLRPAVMTGITYFTNKETQTRAISLLRMAFNFGLSIGPAFAGGIIETHGYELIFTIDSLTCLAAAFFLLKFVKNKKVENKKDNSSKDDMRSPYKDVKFLWFMFFSFLMLVSFFQILFTAPLFMKEVLGYTERHVGYFFAANGLLIFFVEMPLVHYLERKLNSFLAMKIGAIMMGGAIFIFVFDFPPLFLVVFYTLFVSIGEIVNFPFIASTSMTRASKETIGKYMAVNTVMFSFSLILAPVIGMRLLENYGYDVMFTAMFLFCVASVIGLRIIKKHFIVHEPISSIA